MSLHLFLQGGRITTSATCLLLFVILIGCATASAPAQNQSSEEEEEENEDYITDIYCFPPVDAVRVTFPRTLPLLVPDNEQSDALAFLSPTSRQIAKVIQVESLLAQIPILEDEVSQNIPDARVRLVELRQAISDHVLVALFDAFSTAAELECEKGRADALASGMEEKQNDIQQRRTVIALLADATAGFLSGIFLFGGADVLAGGADIIGNILQGSFGWAALGGQQQFDLRLTRNHLKDVWEGPDSSSLFPQSVWGFLNSPLRQGRIDSRRQLIVEEWKTRFGSMEKDKELRRKELFFGGGGTFTGTQLRHRAEMLDRVKSSVRLMGKDLNLLLKESLGHLNGMSQIVHSETMMLH
jgi:hypothetical protein